MLKVGSILVIRSGLALCVLAVLGCGQKGPLEKPSGEAAMGRATLIETLTPDALRQHQASPPTSPPPVSPPPVSR